MILRERLLSSMTVEKPEKLMAITRKYAPEGVKWKAVKRSLRVLQRHGLIEKRGRWWVKVEEPTDEYAEVMRKLAEMHEERTRG